MADDTGSGGVLPEENSRKSGEDRVDENIVNRTGEDYSKYVYVDATKEMNQFEDNIEEMLTRLDEFLGLVDIIRADTSLCLNQTLPRILAKGQAMEQTFEKIDKLEAFVAMVKQQMNAMEEAVSQAEDEMGSLSSFKKMFSSISMPTFLSKKNTAKQTPPKPKTKFEPPVIYKTEDYLILENYENLPQVSSASAKEEVDSFRETVGESINKTTEETSTVSEVVDKELSQESSKEDPAAACNSSENKQVVAS